MVYYLSPGSTGVENINSNTWGILDVPANQVNRRIEYAEPGNVHPSALKDNATRREQGYWVKPETLPKKLLWAKGTKPALPDVMFWFAVSPRFKDLVEQFEPGVHQFAPVEVYHSRNGEPVATYYWFIVGQRLDSVDRNLTSYAWVPSKNNLVDGHWARHVINYETLEMTEIEGAKLIFNNSQVAGHHIWHDPHVLSFNNGLCSDSFGASRPGQRDDWRGGNAA